MYLSIKQNATPQYKEIICRYTPQDGQISKTLHWAKKVFERIYTVWLYTYETSEKTNIIYSDRK